MNSVWDLLLHPYLQDLQHNYHSCRQLICFLSRLPTVKFLRYKPEDRGFDSRWCQQNFSLTQSFRPHYGPGVYSASNRNEYQEYFLGVKAAGTWGWHYHLHVPTVLKSGSLNPLEPSRPVQACNEIALPFTVRLAQSCHLQYRSCIIQRNITRPDNYHLSPPRVWAVDWVGYVNAGDPIVTNDICQIK